MNKEEQLKKWKEMINSMFSNDVPLTKEWTFRENIIYWLDHIATQEALNYTFLPDGGGLALMGCTYANERDCIELNLGGIKHVLKPKKLTFQWYTDAECDLAYFLLEADNLHPIFLESSFKKEILVEIAPSEYIERKYWDVGVFQRKPLPRGTRLVSRYISGSIHIFSKADIYNKISDYKGRQDKVTQKGDRNHIQKSH